jgi:hypothetical protein
MGEWAQITSTVTAPRPPTTFDPGACTRWVCLPCLRTLLHRWHHCTTLQRTWWPRHHHPQLPAFVTHWAPKQPQLRIYTHKKYQRQHNRQFITCINLFATTQQRAIPPEQHRNPNPPFRKSIWGNGHKSRQL